LRKGYLGIDILGALRQRINEVICWINVKIDEYDVI
jgi:hypothetical protein